MDRTNKPELAGTHRGGQRNVDLELIEAIGMEFGRKVAKLLKKLNNLEEHLGDVTDELLRLLQDLDQLGLSIFKKARLPNPQGADAKEEKDNLLKALARQGVAKVTIERHADRGSTVTVEGYPELDLPPTLTDLLECLCEESGTSDDGLVGYKRREDLLKQLAVRANKRFSERAFSQLLSRLRKTFEASGINPFLVQTRRGRGFRFALKRPDPCDLG